METVTIPDTVIEIQSDAFRNSGVTSIKIPDSVTSYGGAFLQDCTKLTEVQFSKSVPVIPSSMCYGCTALLSVELPDIVTELGNSSFYNCTEMISFKAGNDLLTIGNNCFNGCKKLASVDLNDGLLEIGNYAFAECTTLPTIVLPNSIKSLGSYCFYKDTKLANVTLPNGLKEIPSYGFASCISITQLTIPKGIKVIKDNAFLQDSKLKSFTIPASVTSIGSNAFSYATTTVVTGVKGSYAESFAKWKTFTDATVPASSVKLASGKNAMTIGRYQTVKPVFTIAPANSTDFVKELTSDNTSAVRVQNDGLTLYGSWSGTANITATTYGGLTFTFPVTVDTLSGIEIESQPTVTEFALKARKDISGLGVNAVFTNGDKEPIFDYTISGFITDVLGDHDVTVSYDRNTATFPISVVKMLTGNMGVSNELTWTYSSKSHQVTVTGPVTASDPVLVASYDENGKMLSVDFITEPGDSGKADSQADTIKLFWVDDTSTPKCACVDVTE